MSNKLPYVLKPLLALLVLLFVIVACGWYVTGASNEHSRHVEERIEPIRARLTIELFLRVETLSLSLDNRYDMWKSIERSCFGHVPGNMTVPAYFKRLGSVLFSSAVTDEHIEQAYRSRCIRLIETVLPNTLSDHLPLIRKMIKNTPSSLGQESPSSILSDPL